MRTSLVWCVLCVLVSFAAVGQESATAEIAIAEIPTAEPARTAALRTLAAETIARYRDADRAAYLGNLYRLQLAAGRPADALKTLDTLRAERGATTSPQVRANEVPFEIFTRAQIRGGDSADAIPIVFREVFGSLDDRTAALAAQMITGGRHTAFAQTLQASIERQKGKSTIAVTDALRIGRELTLAETFGALAPAVSLVEDDDKRRYTIDNAVRIATSDGATVCAQLMRPRGATQRLPALLSFTIYVDPFHVTNMLRRGAAHGYASVVAFTRGKSCSDSTPVPYEHDSRDAAATIDWIAAQPWSDGRVGMYGGSYSGFTAWAAAKQRPKALKALMVGAPAGPGIDVPMEGNVFWNFVYPWPFYTTNNKTLDDATYYDRERWARLDIATGRAYRDLAKIDGTPNPIFERWISHPSYDGYWRSMIPYREEFSRVDIPVLTTAGYYYGGPGAAVYYVAEHMKYKPDAEHYLLAGPYDHGTAQHGTITLSGGQLETLAGYRLDPVARIDLGELRYEWFDYVLRGAPRPAILKDRVNYQVTGANAWKHAPSIGAMGKRAMRFYLSPDPSAKTHRLSAVKPKRSTSITQTIDFADRSDVGVIAPGGGVLDRALDSTNGLVFISEPFKEATELSGLFSGHVELIANKKDFDFAVSLFEQTPAGEYFQLSPFWSRASYVRDPTRRQLLTPGRRERLDFRSMRLMSRQMSAGSRLVVVLQVLKETGRQINYGSGKEVSTETIADAREPLRVQWFGTSYVEVPAAK